jgi:hypothetical protein
VKTVRSEVTDRAKRPAVVCRVDALRGVLYDYQLVFLGDCHRSIHVTRNSGIVHDENGSGVRVYSLFDQPFVDIQSVRTNIDEDRLRSGANNGVSS